MLVGTTGGIADPRGDFTVVARDFARNPIAGVSVVIDFAICASDVHISSVQVVAGSYGVCDGSTVRGITNAQGVLTLRVVGSAGPSGPTFGCAQIYADGVRLGELNVSALDTNGSGGLNPADFSAWLGDSFQEPVTYVARSDFDCSRTVGPPDLAVLIQASLAGGSSTSGTTYCR